MDSLCNAFDSLRMQRHDSSASSPNLSEARMNQDSEEIEKPVPSPRKPSSGQNANVPFVTIETAENEVVEKALYPVSFFFF